ncbi:30S ribosomal protein S20 [Culicoidibacter larvae]|uniref:Small ribosomal subunit protein bS20 n=1 Tax=Culicoidibacter larvae TaxID=2579976 RepID=A0A5R8QB68_9FIRM|nr:30S ribosomal protein S20 [Culicoidibacter larvae]TLG73788.1 30S ribosomal protein S20 [Culicoidibacter larvae]
MANIKSQIKRNKTNEKKRLANQSYKSSMRTAMKQVEAAITNNEKELANEKLVLVYKKLDKAVSKGIVHKNYANRQKSRLTTSVNALG